MICLTKSRKTSLINVFWKQSNEEFRYRDYNDVWSSIIGVFIASIELTNFVVINSLLTLPVKYVEWLSWKWIDWRKIRISVDYKNSTKHWWEELHEELLIWYLCGIQLFHFHFWLLNRMYWRSFHTRFDDVLNYIENKFELNQLILQGNFQ